MLDQDVHGVLWAPLRQVNPPYLPRSRGGGRGREVEQPAAQCLHQRPVQHLSAASQGLQGDQQGVDQHLKPWQKRRR